MWYQDAESALEAYGEAGADAILAHLNENPQDASRLGPVLERLANEARASGALCRLRQQAELLQRRTVLGGGGHARCGWPPARVDQRW